MVSDSHKKEVEENRAYLKKVIETIIWIGRQGLALRGHDESDSSMNRGNFLELLSLRAEDCEFLKKHLDTHRSAKYTSPDIQKEIIGLINKLTVAEIVSDVHKAVFFCVICDETMDIAKKEQLSLCVRFCLPDLTIHERFLGFWTTANTDSATLYQLIKDVLLQLGLQISNVRAQCYDGASNMKGHTSGVATRICQDEPRAIYMHCHAHLLNLSLKDSCKTVKEARNMLGTVKALYDFIEASAKRHDKFQQLRKTVNPGSGPVTLKALCETRWSARSQSLNSVLALFEVVIKTLDQISEEDATDVGAQAASLLKAVSTFEFILFLRILERVFSVLQSLCEGLQSSTVSLQQARLLANATIEALQDLRTQEQFNNFWVETQKMADDYNISPPELPRRIRIPSKCNGGAAHHFDSIQDQYRTSYYEVLDTIHSELTNRFNENDYTILIGIEKLFDCVLKDQPVSATEFSQVVNFYGSDLDQHGLKCQLEVLRGFCRSHQPQPKSIDDLAVHVRYTFSTLPGAFIQVQKLLQIFYLLPISSASAERSFSTLRRVKTWQRSTMDEERLRGLALMNIEKEAVRSLDLDKILDVFASAHGRRLKLI